MTIGIGEPPQMWRPSPGHFLMILQGGVSSRAWPAGQRPPPTRSWGCWPSATWSAWELDQQLRRNMRFFWPRAESQIFDEAKSLVARGLARDERSSPGARARTSYAITAPGRQAVSEWLATAPRPTALECEPLLRLFFADSGTAKQALAASARSARWRRHPQHRARRRPRVPGRHRAVPGPGSTSGPWSWTSSPTTPRCSPNGPTAPNRPSQPGPPDQPPAHRRRANDDQREPRRVPHPSARVTRPVNSGRPALP